MTRQTRFRPIGKPLNSFVPHFKRATGFLPGHMNSERRHYSSQSRRAVEERTGYTTRGSQTHVSCRRPRLPPGKPYLAPDAFPRPRFRHQKSSSFYESNRAYNFQPEDNVFKEPSKSTRAHSFQGNTSGSRVPFVHEQFRPAIQQEGLGSRPGALSGPLHRSSPRASTEYKPEPPNSTARRNPPLEVLSRSDGEWPLELKRRSTRCSDSLSIKRPFSRPASREGERRGHWPPPLPQEVSHETEPPLPPLNYAPLKLRQPRTPFAEETVFKSEPSRNRLQAPFIGQEQPTMERSDPSASPPATSVQGTGHPLPLSSTGGLYQTSRAGPYSLRPPEKQNGQSKSIQSFSFSQQVSLPPRKFSPLAPNSMPTSSQPLVGGAPPVQLLYQPHLQHRSTETLQPSALPALPSTFSANGPIPQSVNQECESAWLTYYRQREEYHKQYQDYCTRVGQTQEASQHYFQVLACQQHQQKILAGASVPSNGLHSQPTPTLSQLFSQRGPAPTQLVRPFVPPQPQLPAYARPPPRAYFSQPGSGLSVGEVPFGSVGHSS